jgi:hypothetical protein
MTKSWVRSVLVVCGLGAAGVLMACAGAAVVFFLRHRQSEPASPHTAAAEFRELRARFAGQAPLLDVGAQPPLSAVSARQGTAPLHSFHTVVFDTRDSRRLVRITVPAWFGRLYARHDGGYRWLGELTFLDDTEFDPVPIDLSLAAIERHGPGLLVDYRHPSGGQFIAWVE